jgi:hypothetical protein
MGTETPKIRYVATRVERRPARDRVDWARVVVWVVVLAFCAAAWAGVAAAVLALL